MLVGFHLTETDIPKQIIKVLKEDFIKCSLVLPQPQHMLSTHSQLLTCTCWLAEKNVPASSSSQGDQGQFCMEMTRAKQPNRKCPQEDEVVHRAHIRGHIQKVMENRIKRHAYFGAKKFETHTYMRSSKSSQKTCIVRKLLLDFKIFSLQNKLIF